MKNTEEGHLLAFTFNTLGANRIWFKDYITSFLPFINHQFRARKIFAPWQIKFDLFSFLSTILHPNWRILCLLWLLEDWYIAGCLVRIYYMQEGEYFHPCLQRKAVSQQGEEERVWVGRPRKMRTLNWKRYELWVSDCFGEFQEANQQSQNICFVLFKLAWIHPILSIP